MVISLLDLIFRKMITSYHIQIILYVNFIEIN